MDPRRELRITMDPRRELRQRDQRNHPTMNEQCKMAAFRAAFRRFRELLNREACRSVVQITTRITLFLQ